MSTPSCFQKRIHVQCEETECSLPKDKWATWVSFWSGAWLTSNVQDAWCIPLEHGRNALSAFHTIPPRDPILDPASFQEQADKGLTLTKTTQHMKHTSIRKDAQSPTVFIKSGIDCLPSPLCFHPRHKTNNTFFLKKWKSQEYSR